MGLLFFLLFFIFAALGVELFGRLECSEEIPCQGLGEHAHFANFGMAFLTLFRVATGDNWNGIMKDTLRDECDDAADCVKNCCVSSVIAPIFFVIFVLMAQFVLVNVVVAVLMKHLEESHKQMEEVDIETELEMEMKREQLFEEEQALCKKLEKDEPVEVVKRSLTKVNSLPSNFTYSTPIIEKKINFTPVAASSSRRSTVQYFNPLLGGSSAPLSLLDYNKPPVEKTCSVESRDSAPFYESMAMTRRSSRTPACRKNLLKKFRTHSFDVKLLETMESVEMDSDGNMKPSSQLGQSKGKEYFDDHYLVAKSNSSLRGRKASAAAVSPSCSSSGRRKFNYRQASLDVDSFRTNACKDLLGESSAAMRNYNKTFNNNSANKIMNNEGANASISSDNINTTATTTTLMMPSNSNNSSNECCDDTSKASSFLIVPKLQASARNRSGSTKQLFKQKALDEDETTTNEKSLLLPGDSVDSGSETAAVVVAINQCSSSNLLTQSMPIPQIQCPAQTSNNDRKLSTTSSSSTSTASAVTSPKVVEQTATPKSDTNTLTVESIDGNVKKSESSELLRIISERRKF